MLKLENQVSKEKKIPIFIKGTRERRRWGGRGREGKRKRGTETERQIKTERWGLYKRDRKPNSGSGISSVFREHRITVTIPNTHLSVICPLTCHIHSFRVSLTMTATLIV